MSCDKLVFDLSQEIEGSPNIFVKKDWLNILDNQNGNYSANQSVVDTSQLSNSNKYLNYREAYLSVPMIMALSTTTPVIWANGDAATSADYSMGLKNWFGSIIHSFTLDYNGTTIIQQTPFCNMWNSFKLMTTLSWNDIAVAGATIGFYPDDPLSFGYSAAANAYGKGTFNNSNFENTNDGFNVSTSLNKYSSGSNNIGFRTRQTYINYNPNGVPVTSTYGALFLNANGATANYKSYISSKVTGTGAIIGSIVFSIRATIYLKHLHSFFNMVPLLKGVYMKMTMNLNNSTTNVTVVTGASIDFNSSSVPVGGVLPFMISSAAGSNGNATLPSATYIASLSVGNVILDATQKANVTATGSLGPNIFLYVPAYTFNPVFEQAYLSSPIKTINYTDIYQYQVINVTAGSTFNNLLTNGLANIKSVLILPFFVNGAAANSPPFQSPFDPAGCGPTSPLCLLSNFNVVVSGQNAIYNTQRYSFEEFNNQLYGANAVNGGMTDGLNSGLFSQLGFEMEYCYHYVNVSRCLPVEESVPKSVQIVGTNTSAQVINLWCFVEYGVSVSIDILTGARV